MKNNLLMLLLLVATIACEQKSDTDSTFDKAHAALKDTLTDNLTSAFEKDAIVGLSVAVVNEDGFLYEKGFGYTDLAFSKNYTSNTTQNIASISKTLIGIALLKAQEQGKLKLDDPINKYLPFEIKNPGFPDTPILIEHLAYHTASIIDLDEVYSKSYVLEKSTHAENEAVFTWFSKPKDRVSLIEFLENTLTLEGQWYQEGMFANTKPGEVSEYSNIGAALCAQVIENATGQDYRDYTKAHILNPLNMTASGWSSADIDTTQRSNLFYDKENLLAAYSLITYPDGGFITSTKDLGNYLIELMKGYSGKGTLLSKESYEQLFERKQFPNTEPGQAQGIFMDFTDEFIRIKGDMVGHNGSDPGVLTAMYFRPDTGTGKIMLSNTESDDDNDFWPEAVAVWKALMEYEKEYAALKATGS